MLEFTTHSRVIQYINRFLNGDDCLPGSKKKPLREIGFDVQKILGNYHKVVYYKEDVKVPFEIVDKRMTEREYEIHMQSASIP